MQTFKKEERLFGKQAVSNLFDHGRHFTEYPFRVVWQESDTECKYPVQVLITVSKKNIKTAVMRNRLKRRIREAYRKNKSNFYDFLTDNHISYKLGLIYISKEEIQYAQIEKKILKVFDRLKNMNY